jgi:hypothetical protein
MSWLHLLDEFSGLLAICMCRKTYFRHIKVYTDGPIALHTFDEISFFEIVGNRALSAVPCNNNAIPRIMTPPLKQSSGLTALKHTWSAHDNHRISLFLENSLI